MAAGTGKKMRWGLEYALLCLLLVFVRLAPERWWRSAGRWLGGWIHGTVGYRRRVVQGNLLNAFPDLGQSEIDNITVSTYQRLGETLFEFLALPGWDSAEITNRVVGLDIAELKELHDQGRGAILMTGHFGNWELLGAAVAAAGIPIQVVARTQTNPWSDRLQNRIREQSGLRVLKAETSVRDIVKAVRRGEFVAMLPDVDAGTDGVFVDFLGRQASTPRGVAYFAWKLGCPIVTRFARSDGNGRYHIIDTGNIVPDADQDEQTAVHSLTTAMLANLETAVRSQPDHYLWLHRRWKSRPPTESNVQQEGTSP
jgi:Kdo2-lipid IVA lauroyltransferase/acyltransferase